MTRPVEPAHRLQLSSTTLSQCGGISSCLTVHVIWRAKPPHEVPKNDKDPSNKIVYLFIHMRGWAGYAIRLKEILPTG